MNARNSLHLVAFGLLAVTFLGFAQAPQGVRGKISSINGSVMTLATPAGAATVHLVKGYKVYDRVAASEADIKPDSFVGITTVKDKNGREVASEVHIFPAALKGLGEGTRMMGTNDASGRANRMTNGTVRKPKDQSRMTNGRVVKDSGGTVVLSYKGGSLPIVIPRTAKITEITLASKTALQAGRGVFALGPKQKDGSWNSALVMLTDSK